MSTRSREGSLRFLPFRSSDQLDAQVEPVGIVKGKMEMATSATKKEMQNLIDQIGEKVADMLNPVFTREELVEQMQELDELVNGSEDDDEEALEDEDEDETDD